MVLRRKVDGGWIKRLLVVVLVGILVFDLYEYFFPSAPRLAPLPELTLPSGGSVVVVAPHSDDEILGAGGLVKRALEAHNQVTVVLVTNGDGFTIATERWFRHLRPSPADYENLGYVRQQESTKALGIMGLSPEQIIFLGYPDRGVSQLWDNHWADNHPYLSRYTRSTRSPYRNGLHRGTVYAGESLLRDLTEVLRDKKPDLVVYPHPNDAHVDHWATYNFVAYALDELRREGVPWADHTREWLYLVHRGDWPTPKGLRPHASLLPPPALLTPLTNWGSLPLDPATVAQKERAILAYKSQITVLRRFLVSFARQNELFGEVGHPTAVAVPPGRITVDGQIGDWAGIEPVLNDPAKDTIIREMEAGGDLLQLFAARDPDRLYLRLDVRGSVPAFVTYLIRLRPLAARGAARPLDLLAEIPGPTLRLREANQVSGGWAPPPPGMAVAFADRTLELSLPLELLGRPEEVFVGVESWFTRVQIDRMAWRPIILPRLAGQ